MGIDDLNDLIPVFDFLNYFKLLLPLATLLIPSFGFEDLLIALFAL